MTQGRGKTIAINAKENLISSYQRMMMTMSDVC